jgi:hypothetical protein
MEISPEVVEITELLVTVIVEGAPAETVDLQAVHTEAHQEAMAVQVNVAAVAQLETPVLQEMQAQQTQELLQYTIV